MADKMNGGSCGSKHLKLMLWMVGTGVVVVAIVLTYGDNALTAQDTRLRAVENGNASIGSKLEAVKDRLDKIDRSLVRIDDKLDGHKEP